MNTMITATPTTLSRLAIPILLVWSWLVPATGLSWEITRDFNSGQVGQKAQQTPDGFDHTAGGSLYSNEQSFEGGQSAKLHISQGETAFGKWGGIIDFPARVTRGEKVWLELYVYFPSLFQVSTGAGSMKFLRFYAKTQDGQTSTGALDIQIIDDQFTYNEFRMARELQFVWFPYGDNNILSKDQWHRVNVEISVDHIPKGQGGQAYVKFWLNGNLLANITDIQTIINATDYMHNFLLFTYYNGGSPIDQHMWVDKISLTNVRPAWMDTFEGLVDPPMPPVILP